MSFEQHLVTLFTHTHTHTYIYIYIYQVLDIKKIKSATFYPATGQTFGPTLSKKVKLLASHAMLLKPMQS